MPKRDYSIQKPVRCKTCQGLLRDDAVYDGEDRVHTFCAYVRVRKREEDLKEENARLRAELERIQGKPPLPGGPQVRPPPRAVPTG